MQGEVLIVDAIATNRIKLKVELATTYYQMLKASSAKEAAAMAGSEAPDPIICSLTLPHGANQTDPIVIQAVSGVIAVM